MLLMQLRGVIEGPVLPSSVNQPALQASQHAVGVVAIRLAEEMEVNPLSKAGLLRSDDGLSIYDMGHHMAFLYGRDPTDGARGFPTNFGFRAELGMAGNSRKENFHLPKFNRWALESAFALSKSSACPATVFFPVSLQNISANQIVIWCALLLGLLAAVVIGSAIGSSDMRMVAGLIALMPVAIIFVKLKTNIWVLLPLGWYLTGRLPWLPLPFTVRDLLFMTVIGFFTLFFATRALPLRRKLGLLDYLIYVNIAYLATVYVRNPVGFWALQTEMVGGRPYFEILLTFGAFAILSRVQVTDFVARIFPLLFIIPATTVAVLDIVARVLPQFAYPLAMLYSGVGSLSIAAGIEGAAQIGEDRITGLKDAGYLGVLALCARYNPITLISPLHPMRATLFALALAAIFLSGFRATLLAAMVFFLLATLLRGRLRDVWVAAAVGMLGITLLISLQGSVLQLPLTMQRALSWLPGDWNQEALAGAEDSTRWRLEMVEWAWNDDRILRNKIWGQGIGLSIDDMNLIASSLMAGQGGANLLGGSDRENFMITGAFHNGPISAIKCVGVVGLFLYSLLLIYIAVRAWRLCVLTAGSRAFSLALFVGMPAIYFPFSFFVLTGFYELDLNYSIFSAGLINLTDNYYRNLSTEKSVGIHSKLKPIPGKRDSFPRRLVPLHAPGHGENA
jgi:hypothetical protein